MMGAYLSGDMAYRYALWREWDWKLPRLYWVMLNPSTADADINDATIRKCIGFAARANYGGIHVVNLFAFRATDPKFLRTIPRARTGPANDFYIRQAVRQSLDVKSNFMVGWGGVGSLYQDRVADVRMLLPTLHTYCLGLTKSGHPKHPLYVPYDTPWEQYHL